MRSAPNFFIGCRLSCRTKQLCYHHNHGVHPPAATAAALAPRELWPRPPPPAGRMSPDASIASSRRTSWSRAEAHAGSPARFVSSELSSSTPAGHPRRQYTCSPPTSRPPVRSPGTGPGQPGLPRSGSASLGSSLRNTAASSGLLRSQEGKAVGLTRRCAEPSRARAPAARRPAPPSDRPGSAAPPPSA